MLRLGIIGTGTIAHQFAQACQHSGRFTLCRVYSRHAETADSFAEDFPGMEGFSGDLATFLSKDALDVVYVATPNSVHYAQTMAAVRQGLHVIVEKPIFSTVAEWDAVYAEADARGCFVFDAARHIHEPLFARVGEWVAEHRDQLDGAFFPFLQYSSRIEAVYRGEQPNVFSPQFSGGTLVDLGVYPLYCARIWFGMPERVVYHALPLQTGVDGYGTIILSYPTFDVTLLISKKAQSYLSGEIYARNETLTITQMSRIEQVVVRDCRTQSTNVLGNQVAPYAMIDEALAFATMITEQDVVTYHQLRQYSRDVLQLMERMRQQIQLVFPADQEEGT